MSHDVSNEKLWLSLAVPVDSDDFIAFYRFLVRQGLAKFIFTSAIFCNIFNLNGKLKPV